MVTVLTLVVTLAPVVMSAQAREAGTPSDTYQSASIDANGNLTIVTTTGQPVIVRKEGEQTAFSRPVISAAGTAVAAQALIGNCCTSYDIPVQVVVYAQGKVHRFTGAKPVKVPEWVAKLSAARGSRCSR